MHQIQLLNKKKIANSMQIVLLGLTDCITSNGRTAKLHRVSILPWIILPDTNFAHACLAALSKSNLLSSILITIYINWFILEYIINCIGKGLQWLTQQLHPLSPQLI